MELLTQSSPTCAAPQHTQFITYKEAEQSVLRISSVCHSLGLKRNDKIGVLGINSPEWMMAMQVLCPCTYGRCISQCSRLWAQQLIMV